MKEIWKTIKNYEKLYEISNLGRVRSLPRKGTYKDIHRLVAEAFIPNSDNLPQVNHKDGNKKNNCVDNLEWCSNEYNMQEAIRLGLRKNVYKKGKEHWNSISVLQYDLKGNFIKEWYCIKDIERKLGFDNRNISACCRHKRNMAYGYIWRYIDDNSKIEYKPKTHNGRN